MDIRTFDQRAALAAGRPLDPAALRSTPDDALARALDALAPEELARLCARLDEAELADLMARLTPTDAARLLGRLGRARLADTLLEEANEDIERLGGSEPLDEPYLRSGVGRIVGKRIRWLLLLFVAEAYTGTVLRHFEAELQAVVALTFFIPLLIGTGGNTGSFARTCSACAANAISIARISASRSAASYARIATFEAMLT